MNDQSGGQQDRSQVVADLRQRIAEAEEREPAELQLNAANRLAERAIKRTSWTDAPEKVTLRRMVDKQKFFLGPRMFRKASRAVDTRNRVAHDDVNGLPSDNEMKEATQILLDVVRMHIDAFENRRPSTLDLPERKKPVATKQKRTKVKPRNYRTVKRVNQVEYATEITRQEAPDLTVADSERYVSVTALAEHVFCQRAGLLAHESEYSGDEELPSTGALPWFERDKIIEELDQITFRIIWVIIAFVVSTVVATTLLAGLGVFLLIQISLTVAAMYVLIHDLQVWMLLRKRVRQADSANICHLDLTKEHPQEVSWWGLLKNGFEVSRPKRLEDEEWMLRGRPRRLVTSANGVMIPVHRTRSRDTKLQPQHIARVMAYCHLLHVKHGITCPCAIVLFGDSYVGTTVPNTPDNRRVFYEVLRAVRRTISDSDSRDRQPDKPPDLSVCRFCHFGRPRPVDREEKTTRYGKPLPPRFMVSRSRKVLHCSCGDRFDWKPKHEHNARLRSLDSEDA